MRLTLVRHGETTSNVAGALDTGFPGAALTVLGRRQAAAIVPALMGVDLDAVYSSNLRRARETVAPIAHDRGLYAEALDGLREIDAGVHEMATDADSVRSYLEVLGSWLGGDLSAALPGSVDGEQFLARFDAAVEQIHGTGVGHALAVSHGAAIRMWATLRADNLADFPESKRLHNTGFVVLEGEPSSGWRVVSWQSDPMGGEHLDADDPIVM